ncbi:MAG TPA: DUF2283 domain-containing protein [Phycisphaerae bacterium]|jgi:hypothetical protein|nr:DUF2283 domain-containing protein [Phycisphaerae bacterium]
MHESYLQLSYRKGKLLAGYLYLDKPGSKSARSRQAEAGLVIDFAADGHPIGIEITSPSLFTLEALNRVMLSLNLSPASTTDLAPLVAA